MTEPQKIPATPVPVPATPTWQITRLVIGFLWILAPFAIIALICYLRWPAVMHLVERFYQKF